MPQTDKMNVHEKKNLVLLRDNERMHKRIQRLEAMLDRNAAVAEKLDGLKNELDNTLEELELRNKALDNEIAERLGSNEALQKRMEEIAQTRLAMLNIMEDLKIATSNAEAATQAKSDFLANMSHEIRTPMNAVLGLNYLLMKTDLNTKQRDYARKISQSAENLLGIINDILDFSKIEAGKLDVESIPFDLDDVLNNLSNLMGVKAQDKELELIIARNTDVPIGLIGDPLRLGQILLNLSTNAIKFTEKGEITIRVELIKKTTKKAMIKFNVIDSGIGLTKEQQAKLFKSFQQADTSTTRKYGGTGLGLTISKSLVEKMQGQIDVESKKGKGSNFYFTAEFGLQKKQVKKKQIVPERLSDMRVLVVDDHEIAREVLRDYCEDFQFIVDTANDGDETIKAVTKAVKVGNPYGLIFLDWKMPGMTGTEAAIKILNDPKIKIKPKIIMVTSYGREEIRQKAEQAGIDAFLIKPVSQSLLFDSIAEVFGEEIEREDRSVRQVVKPEDLDTIRGARILLAEDNEINQQVAIELLESEGFQVTLAENGEEAVKAVKNTTDQFDLVLMDLQMPVMDGYQATSTIRKNQNFDDLPILAMTADAMTGVRDKVVESGMNDYITKPIDLKVLFEALIQWIKPDSSRMGAAVSGKPDKQEETEVIDFSSLNGIDFESGIKRVAGNTKLYRSLLTKFLGNNLTFNKDVRTLVNKGKQEDAIRAAHSLKGVSGNIGAKELHLASKELEALLGQKPFNAVNAEKGLELLNPALSRVLDSIQVWLDTTTKDIKPAVEKPLDIEKVKAQIKTLDAALKEYDADAGQIFEDLRDLTGSMEVDSELIIMENAIGNYDFDKAREALQALSDKLQDTGDK